MSNHLLGGSNSTAIVGNTAGSKATLRCDGTAGSSSVNH